MIDMYSKYNLYSSIKKYRFGGDRVGDDRESVEKEAQLRPVVHTSVLFFQSCSDKLHLL